MKTVALIEDDADLFALLKYNLEKEGFRFAGSPTGRGALEFCRRERPDLVILDIMLPDSDGIEICRGIRSSPDLAHIPVIFLTARASESDRILGLELGANDYVVKPFSLRELIARVRSQLRAPARLRAFCGVRAWSSIAIAAASACTTRRLRSRPPNFACWSF